MRRMAPAKFDHAWAIAAESAQVWRRLGVPDGLFRPLIVNRRMVSSAPLCVQAYRGVFPGWVPGRIVDLQDRADDEAPVSPRSASPPASPAASPAARRDRRVLTASTVQGQDVGAEDGQRTLGPRRRASVVGRPPPVMVVVGFGRCSLAPWGEAGSQNSGIGANAEKSKSLWWVHDSPVAGARRVVRRSCDLERFHIVRWILVTDGAGECRCVFRLGASCRFVQFLPDSGLETPFSVDMSKRQRSGWIVKKDSMTRRSRPTPLTLCCAVRFGMSADAGS